MIQFKEILKELCDNEAIQNLVKADNQVASDDPDALVFADDNSKLSVKLTDNSLSFSYSSVSKPDTTRDDFTAFCDTLDDDFFQEVCEHYTNLHGEGSLNELNKNLTKENIKEFYNHIAKVIDLKVSKLKNYAVSLADASSKL